MSDTEKKQAEEIAELRAKLAAAEKDRDRYHAQYFASESQKDTLERMFVRIFSGMCQRD